MPHSVKDMSDTEDIWADSSDEEHVDYERNLAEREWERLQEDHGNTGYKEGIVEGKEVNMQRGFDQGYVEGLAVGKAIGRLRGLVSCQLVYYRQLAKDETAASKLEALFDEIDKIQVDHVYSVEYFKKGEKKKEDYVSPQKFVQQLEDKVKTTLASL